MIYLSLDMFLLRDLVPSHILHSIIIDDNRIHMDCLGMMFLCHTCLKQIGYLTFVRTFHKAGITLSIQLKSVNCTTQLKEVPLHHQFN